MEGYTISGNRIKIEANKDYDDFGYSKRWYWSDISIEMNGNTIDIDDMTDRNKEHIIEQLPQL